MVFGSTSQGARALGRDRDQGRPQKRRTEIILLIFVCVALLPIQLAFAQEEVLSSGEEVELPCTCDVAQKDEDSDGESTAPESTDFRLDCRIDAGYHSHPIHPYFRDSYRVVADMRRLVRFVDRRSVNGYESVGELVETCRNLPRDDQKEILGAAIAGCFVNYLSEATNKQLRKRKAEFVQWKLERVILRKGFNRLVQASAFAGVTSQGFGLYVPRVRILYSRQFISSHLRESIAYWPTSRFGLDFTRYDDRTIISPMLATTLGRISLSYDRDLRVVSSRFDLRKINVLVIRLAHVNYLERRNYNYMRAEIMLCW